MLNFDAAKVLFRKGDKKPEVENNIRADESKIKKKQLFVVVLQNRCSCKFIKIHNKIESESVF